MLERVFDLVRIRRKMVLGRGVTLVTTNAAGTQSALNVDELNRLDGVTAGTVSASKAVVVGADKNIDTIAIAEGGLKIGAGAGTAVSASAAELNFNDGAVAGTAVASKTAVLGASKDLDVLNVATLAATTSLAVGGGTVMTKMVVYSQSLDVASVAANTTAEQTFTVTGLTTADKVFVNKPSLSAGLGIVNARVSAADTLALTFVNATAAAIDPAAETYAIVALRS